MIYRRQTEGTEKKDPPLEKGSINSEIVPHVFSNFRYLQWLHSYHVPEGHCFFVYLVVFAKFFSIPK